MIQVKDVTKRYGAVTALENFSLTVPAGAVFGVLGPNGAGKTTLLRLIVAGISPDRGTIRLNGCQRYQLGYLPERPHFPGRFRLREYLAIVGQLAGLGSRALEERIVAVLAQTGLSQVAGWRIAACSKGMLQRFGLAQALLSDPTLLLLDEPFSGLDPAAQVAMRQLLRDLNQAGKTIVLSTHRLSDVSELCSHIAIINHGRLRSSGLLSEVLVPRSRILIRVDRLPSLIVWQLTQLDPDIAVDLERNEIALTGDAMVHNAQVLRLMLDAHIEILQLERQKATLEEFYLETVRK